MLLTTTDVSSLDSALNVWEFIEYVAEALVLAGCVGEYLSEFTTLKTEGWRSRLGRLSLLILIAGLAVELGALIRTNNLAGQEIALLNGVAADARLRAANAEGIAKGFDLKIADSRRDAEIAKEGAAQANERASANEREAARLRAEAERLEKEAEDERTARVKIEDNVAWRTINDAQRKDIGTRLSRFAPQLAECSFLSSDMEAFSFSADLADALRAARWQVIPPSPWVIQMKEISLPTSASPVERLEMGVEITSTPDSRSVDSANAITEELRRLGFDAVYKTTPQRKDLVRVWVSVSHRPLGPQGEAKLGRQRH